MSRNGNGQYTLPPGNPVVPGTTITTEWANNTLSDIATALTGSVASDGQTPMSGNLDMSNNKIVNLTDGVNPQDAATVKQISNPAITGGTINGAVIGNTNPKDGNFLNLTANTGDFSDGLTAPTVTPPSDSSTKVATTAFVQSAISAVSSGVTSFNGRSGAVVLSNTDVTNALGYTPYNAGTNTVVTSQNVLDYTVGKTGQGATGTWGISISGNAASANTANSVEAITSNQVSTALGYVPLSPSSPALQGTPTAPTAPVGTNTTQIATCAFVLANQSGGGAVTSVNGKTGAVTLNAADVGAYASNNPSGYTTLSAVQAQGYTTQSWVQSQGYLSNSTGVTISSAQSISGAKTFTTRVTATEFGVTNGGFLGHDSLQLGTAAGSGVVKNANYVGLVTNGAQYFAGIANNNTFVTSGTDAYKNGSSTAWIINSDSRLKENVTPFTKGLSYALQINPVNFTYNGLAGTIEGTGGVGVIADQIQEVLPETVKEIMMPLNKGDSEEVPIKTFDQTEITWVLVNAVKDLNALVVNLQKEIDALKAK